MVQIVDDLRDVFAKRESPDLASRKPTYVKACLFEIADAENLERFAALEGRLPESLAEIRQFLHDLGIVERCAETLEELRRAIHRIVACTGNHSAYHRLFLSLVDRLASSVYVPPEIEETKRRFEAAGGFHDAVREAVFAFIERMAPHGPPVAPVLAPWQHPHYLYEPSSGTIYYPDLEELADEVAPFQAELLGSNDLDEVTELLRGQLPAVLAHEMFHRWRHANGRLTSDSWHEEYAANRLAVGYVRRFSPETLARSLALAERVLGRFEDRLGNEVGKLLSECETPRAEGRDYGMDLLDAAIVHLEMVRRLARQPLDLEADVLALLNRKAEPEPPARATAGLV
jgi:hypothetical protein